MQPTQAKAASTSTSSTDAGWLAIGIVRRAHGVRGELSVALNDPDALFSEQIKVIRLSPPSRPRAAATIAATSATTPQAPVLCTVQRVRVIPDGLLLQLAQITDRDVAQSWSGAHVEVRVADLPPLAPGEAFVVELEGSTAVDAATGDTIGCVRALSTNGAQPLLILDTPHGERLFPLVDATFAGFDRATRCVRLHVIPGLWDEEG